MSSGQKGADSFCAPLLPSNAAPCLEFPGGEKQAVIERQDFLDAIVAGNRQMQGFPAAQPGCNKIARMLYYGHDLFHRVLQRGSAGRG